MTLINKSDDDDDDDDDEEEEEEDDDDDDDDDYTATYSGSVTRKRIDTNYLTAGVSKKGAPLPP